MKKILVFGNPLVEKDATPIKLLPKLKQTFPKLKFIHMDPTENLEQYGPNLTIIDTVANITKPRIFTLNKETQNKLILPPSFSMHDFDLAYNLKLLLKVDKIKEAKIICLPQGIQFSSLLSFLSTDFDFF